MADKNLMSAIAGLADAKPGPAKKKPKVVNLGKGGSFNVKEGPHPHRNLGKFLHPAKGK